jgi:pimeloyl-ACP methyl ester carboxylesterase
MSIVADSLRFLTPNAAKPNRPLFIFLPGMDGTGKLLHTQLAGIEGAFDIRCLAIPANDLTPWNSMVEQTARLVKFERNCNPGRVVYVCGESFGGCLALQLVVQFPQLCDRLILVNPASAFSRLPWMGWGAALTQWFPDSLYRLSALGLLPFLINPQRVSSANRQQLLTAMQSVTSASAAWRIALLSQFKVENLPLAHIRQPTLILASGADRLLPSKAEADRLVRSLANAQKVTLPESGHACLLETEIKLGDILRSQHFYIDIDIDEPAQRLSVNANLGKKALPINP